ncbi:hypothetical protein, variant [Capsaspora owczarzaki ATCC 30864]|nr:hypothetical protein, variant [Capsaspora owczarzaki ATCC 30864]
MRTPPHPKFLLLPARRFSIHLHLLSGTTEIITGICAFFVDEPRVPSMVVGIVAITHVATALYQTPIVFGSKAVMIPAYLVAEGLHLYFAIRLIIEPESLTWLLNTFLVLHIYVWCRVFYSVFAVFDVLSEHRYTIAIMFSGLLIIPAVVGSIGNLAALVIILIYNLLYVLIMKPDEVQMYKWVVENHRETLQAFRSRTANLLTMGAVQASTIAASGGSLATPTPGLTASGTTKEGVFFSGSDHTVQTADGFRIAVPTTPGIAKAIGKKGTGAGEAGDKDPIPALQLASLVNAIGNQNAMETMTDRQRARAIFRVLDRDGNGRVTMAELTNFFTLCGMEEADMGSDGTGRDLLALFSDASEITFEQFHAWYCDGYNGRLFSQQISAAAETDEGKARIVFDLLDADKSGFLEHGELVYLLSNWGMPTSEASQFLRTFTHATGKVNFGDFFVRMKPLWQYAFKMIASDAERAARRQKTDKALREYSRRLKAMRASLKMTGGRSAGTHHGASKLAAVNAEFDQEYDTTTNNNNNNSNKLSRQTRGGRAAAAGSNSAPQPVGSGVHGRGSDTDRPLLLGSEESIPSALRLSPVPPRRSQPHTATVEMEMVPREINESSAEHQPASTSATTTSTSERGPDSPVSPDGPNKKTPKSAMRSSAVPSSTSAPAPRAVSIFLPEFDEIPDTTI